MVIITTSIGADIFRLNFSHGEHEEKAKLVQLIRSIEKKYNHPIAILADLQVRYYHIIIGIAVNHHHHRNHYYLDYQLIIIIWIIITIIIVHVSSSPSQGPKLRVGTFADTKVFLTEGQQFTFDLKDVPGTVMMISMSMMSMMITISMRYDDDDDEYEYDEYDDEV